MPITRRRRAIPDPFRGQPHGELFSDLGESPAGDRWQPAIDVFETDEALVVRAEIPGLRGEDLRVRVDGDVLHISGVRIVPKQPGVRRLHRMEIAFGPFERTVRIQVPFDKDRVAAHLEDGFLRVVLPKRAPSVRRVDVETE